MNYRNLYYSTPFLFPRRRNMAPPLMLMLSAAIVSAAPSPTPLDISSWRDKRLMVIVAHPDDVEGFAGGTLATLRHMNLNVTTAYLTITSGNAGGDCYDDRGAYRPSSYVCEPEEIALLRRREMKAAGAYLGARHVWRCGFGDGMLVSVHESAVRQRISAYIRAYQPHVVLTHAPRPVWSAPPTCNGACPQSTSLPNWGHNWDDLGFHPDHQRVGEHVFNAIYGGGSSADNDLLFADLAEVGGLHAWQTPELYFFALAAEQPLTHYLRLSSEALRAKANASALHHSQYHAPPLEGVTWVAQQVAIAAGLPEGERAEGFQGWF
jgi:LmbE family N-acetylglucosaminyl deacetylase